MQLNQAKINEFLALRTFRFTLSWRYITVVSFISIAFVIVKLTFLESFWSLTLTISSNIAKILSRGSTLAKITLFENFFEGFLSIYGKWTGPILTPLFLLKMAKIEKNKQYCGKTSAVKLSKVFIFSLLFGKNTISCFNIWDVFTRNQGAVASQRGRIKIWHILFHPHDSWPTSCKKILVQIFSSFVAIDQKGHFRKILTWIFKFDWFFWCHSCIF